MNLVVIFRTVYIRGDDELLYMFTKENPEIVRLILRFTVDNPSADLAINCLIIINKILGLGDKYKTEEFIDLVYEKEASQLLENLQIHPDINVYNFSARIIEKYFDI